MKTYGLIGLSTAIALVLAACSEPSHEYTMADAEEAYADVEYERVAEILGYLAEDGEPLAQYRLGMMHLNGIGVTADEAVAIEWLERARASGYDAAGDELETIYLDHAQSTEDLEAGAAWYQRAAELGSVDAKAVLGSYYLTGSVLEQDIPLAVQYITEAAEGGDIRAQSNLGYMYLQGVGVQRSDAEAFRWYYQAAEGGLVRAQSVVGMLYETGRGTEANVPEAMRWYLNAESEGAPGVAARLGALLVAGEIEPPADIDTVAWVAEAARSGVDGAETWLVNEADGGNARAITQLAEFYEEGEVLPQNSARALDYYRRAAEAGVPAAQLAFSRRLASGNGVEQDYIAAHMWANLAAAGGAEGARDQRDVVARFLSPEDLQRAQEMASAWREARPQ